MSVEVSLSDWPVVVVSFRPGKLHEDIPALLDQFDQILQRETPYATALDTSNISGVPDARARQAIAHWLRDRLPVLRRWNRGDAIYMPSSLLRGALTAIDWLTPPPSPRHYASSMADARAWCRQRTQLSQAAPPSRAP